MSILLTSLERQPDLLIWEQKSKGRLANEEAWGIAGHSTDRERKFVRVYTGPRR